jgi:hypothetical protein
MQVQRKNTIGRGFILVLAAIMLLAVTITASASASPLVSQRSQPLAASSGHATAVLTAQVTTVPGWLNETHKTETQIKPTTTPVARVPSVFTVRRSSEIPFVNLTGLLIAMALMGMTALVMTRNRRTHSRHERPETMALAASFPLRI